MYQIYPSSHCYKEIQLTFTVHAPYEFSTCIKNFQKQKEP